MSRIRKMILSVSLCILLISALVPVAWAEDELAVVGSVDYETTTDKNAQETLTASATTNQKNATPVQTSEILAAPATNADQSTATIPQEAEETPVGTSDSDSVISNEKGLTEQETEEIQTQDTSEVAPGWSSIGSCEWKVEDGCVILRPTGNAEVGYLPNGINLHYSWPWKTAPDIDCFKIEGKIVCGDTTYDMFGNLNSLKSIEGLSNLDTSNVVRMSGMFSNCSSLTSLDLSNFNTSNVTLMTGMFSFCPSLTSVNLSSFDTSNVTDMNSMFLECASLRTVDVSSFNTSNVTDMGAMFESCSSLFSVNLSSFDTSKVGKMDMFGFCPSLEVVEMGPGCTMQRELPDKIWYNAAGEAFTPSTMPIGIATSYATSKELLEPLRVQLSETNKTLRADAAPFTLIATVTPEWKAESITWSTSDAAVATVNPDGQVTVHGPGNATISAKSNGATAECMLTVLPIEANEPEPGDNKPSDENPPINADVEAPSNDSSNGTGSEGSKDTEQNSQNPMSMENQKGAGQEQIDSGDTAKTSSAHASTQTSLAQTGDQIGYFSPLLISVSFTTLVLLFLLLLSHYRAQRTQ